MKLLGNPALLLYKMSKLSCDGISSEHPGAFNPPLEFMSATMRNFTISSKHNNFKKCDKVY